MTTQSLVAEPPQPYGNISKILIPDVILLSQLPQRHNPLEWPGEQLYRAILQDALYCLRKGLQLGVPKKQGRGPRPSGETDPFKSKHAWRHAKESYYWLMTDTSHLPKAILNSYVSIEQCCAAAKIDVDYMRDAIRKMLQQAGKENLFQEPSLST